MRGFCVTVAFCFVFLLLAGNSFAQAQNNPAADPASALTAALAAACRADQAEFSNYLMPASAAVFRALTPDKREAFVKRFSLSDSAGRALVSTSTENHPVLHCQAPSGTAEFRLGETRLDDNLVVLDVSQLSKQWDQEGLAARENAALSVLQSLAAAVESYRRAFGKLPDSLVQLGPAPKDGVSPDQANLIDSNLASGAEAGYKFRYRIASAGEASSSDATFEITAAPAKYGDAGHRSFFLDAAGKLHGADKHGALAEESDPLVEPTPDAGNSSASVPTS